MMCCRLTAYLEYQVGQNWPHAMIGETHVLKYDTRYVNQLDKE
jgi:hypothetical protein